MLYWIESLLDAGVDSILLNTHYLADKVKKFVSDSGYSDKIILSHEEELLGTAGTVRNNIDYISNDPFLLVHADNFTLCNFRHFISAHTERPDYTCMTMMIYNADRPEESGIAKLNTDGVVTKFYEKVATPPGDLANAAVYLLDKEVVDIIKVRALSDFSTEVIPLYMGRINTWHNNLYHIDIGNPDALVKANKVADRLL